VTIKGPARTPAPDGALDTSIDRFWLREHVAELDRLHRMTQTGRRRRTTGLPPKPILPIESYESPAPSKSLPAALAGRPKLLAALALATLAVVALWLAFRPPNQTLNRTCLK